MSNDGRYLYQHNQGLQSQYEYPYPSYDTSVLQHANHRPVRTPSQSHSPQQAQYNPPPSSPYQQPAYPPGSYLNHPPPQQWAGDNNWPQYNQQNYAQPQLQPEAPFHSGPGRPQPSLSTPVSPRNFVQPTPPARHDGRQTPAIVAPVNTSPQNKNRRNDVVASPPVSVAPPGTVNTGLDFRKLLDSYKLIIDANNNYSNGVGAPHARAPPMDTALVERMLQAASFGAQMLDLAVHVQHPSTTTSPPIRSPKVKEPEPVPNKDLGGGSNLAAAAPKRPTQKTEKTDESTQEGQTCLGCGATSTPEWRRGPMGPRTLCNACGLVYAKLIKKRVKESARAGKTNDHAGRAHGGDDLASSAGGDSDDDDYRSRSS